VVRENNNYTPAPSHPTRPLSKSKEDLLFPITDREWDIIAQKAAVFKSKKGKVQYEEERKKFTQKVLYVFSTQNPFVKNRSSPQPHLALNVVFPDPKELKSSQRKFNSWHIDSNIWGIIAEAAKENEDEQSFGGTRWKNAVTHIKQFCKERPIWTPSSDNQVTSSISPSSATQSAPKRSPLLPITDTQWAAFAEKIPFFLFTKQLARHHEGRKKFTQEVLHIFSKKDPFVENLPGLQPLLKWEILFSGSKARSDASTKFNGLAKKHNLWAKVLTVIENKPRLYGGERWDNARSNMQYYCLHASAPNANSSSNE
jgi:hypothetical protein